MLACGGTLNGKKILEKNTVEMMSTPKLNEKQRITYNNQAKEAFCSFVKPYSYGYGVRILTTPDENTVTGKGEWGWAGALGTWAAIDPMNKLFFVYAHQHTPACHSEYVPDILHTVYGNCFTSEDSMINS